MVATALGEVAATDLGVTLSHEHIAIKDIGLALNYPQIAPRRSEHDRAVVLLNGLRERGVRTIIDVTTVDLGRDVDFIVDAARESEMQVVVAAGWHRNAPPFFRKLGVDALSEFIVHDIRDGIANSGVRAGVIKLASAGDMHVSGVERQFRAGARAHRATGVPISTHTEGQSGDEQQRVFAEEGVDLGRVTIGHCSNTRDLAYLKRLMERGSCIGMDHFGLGEPRPHNGMTAAERLGLVVDLCRAGYAERMVISHDAMFTTGYVPHLAAQQAAQPNWQPWYVSDVVLPALRAAGVTGDQIDAMMVGNHRRIFSQDEPY